MRGGLLVRYASLDAEPTSAIAGASVSWRDHNARAAAPVENDHDGVVGSRGEAVRRPDRVIGGLRNRARDTDENILIHPRR